MRIEFIGPPTTGKSTLHKHLATKGIHRAFIEYGRSVEIPESWKPFADKVSASYSDTNLFRKRLAQLPDKTINALKSAYRSEYYPGHIVFDELVAQCGISMAIRHKGDWSWYFEEMPLPGLLVVLSAPKEVLIERNELRQERSRVKKTLRAVKVMPKILSILKARNCNMIELDTSTVSVKQATKEILKNKGFSS
jgi:hypothetical protein